MIQLPGQMVSNYRSHLVKRRVIEGDFADYLKWLRYFLDFCEKHRINGDESHCVRQFLDKLREKKQSEGQRRRAYNAVKLYFEMLKHTQTPTETVALSWMEEAYDSEVIQTVATQQPVNTVRKSFYSEVGYQEKSDSPEWDMVLATMAAEIKFRHYSRKTLKTYANWSRKFQRFLKNKAPKEFIHQWFLPQKNLTLVAESGKRRRWHLHESELQEALYPAVRKAKIPKRVTLPTPSVTPSPPTCCRPVTTSV